MAWVAIGTAVATSYFSQQADEKKSSGDGRPFVQQPPDYGAILANIERASPTVTTEEAGKMYRNPERESVTALRKKYEDLREAAINRLPKAETTLLAELARDASQQTLPYSA